MKEYQQKNEKKYSEVYNHHRIFYNKLYESFLKYGNFNNKSNIIDLGCGTGRYTHLFAKENVASVCGLDKSPDMINEAKKVDPLSSYVVSKVISMPFKNNSFDIAIMSQVIQQIPKKDRKLAFSEINRIIKGNGVFLLNTLSHQQLSELILMKYFPEIFDIEKDRFPDLDTLKKLLKKADFEIDIVKIIEDTRRYDIDELVNFVRDKATSALRIYAASVGQNKFDLKIKEYQKNLKKNYLNNPIYENHNYTLIKCINKK